jgi:hypothetical protein
VGATILDEVGNVTADAPSFSACSGAPVTVSAATGEALFTGAADIQASATSVGEGCVNVSGGGQSDTIHVTVAPAGVRIVGDPIVGYDSQDPAANVIQFTVAAVDAAGAPLTGSVPWEWTSSNEALFYVDRFSGEVTTRSLGTATLRLVSPGGADHSLVLTLAAPAFNGTANPTSGGPGTLVTLTRAGGGIDFDGNTTAFLDFGGVAAYVDNQTASDLVLAVPAVGKAGRVDLVVRNYGPSELDRRVVWTNPTNSFLDIYSPGNTNTSASSFPATIPPGTPEVATIMSANNNVYLSHSGYGTGGAAAGAFNGGSQVDHYFRVTNGGSDIAATLTLSWTNGSDVDLFITDASGNLLAFFISGSPTQEVAAFTFLANTTYHVGVSMFSAGSNNTNMKLNFAGL